MAGAGLHGIKSLGARPVPVLKKGDEYPRKRGRFVRKGGLQCLSGGSRLEGGHTAQDGWGNGAIHLDHQAPLKNDRKREDGEDYKDGHEEAAFDKKLEDAQSEEGVCNHWLVNREAVVDFETAVLECRGDFGWDRRNLGVHD